jgi:predicted RNase H-like nuclease
MQGRTNHNATQNPGVRLPTVLDACVDLWTSRRIAARAVSRLPDVPEWNEDGLRMELVR